MSSSQAGGRGTDGSGTGNLVVNRLRDVKLSFYSFFSSTLSSTVLEIMEYRCGRCLVFVVQPGAGIFKLPLFN